MEESILWDGETTCWSLKRTWKGEGFMGGQIWVPWEVKGSSKEGQRGAPQKLPINSRTTPKISIRE